MRNNARILGLSLSLLSLSSAACLSNDRLLVGQNGTGGANGSGGSTGSTDGGTGGSAGNSNTINRLQHPLPIPADKALTRMAQLIWNAPPDADLLSQAAAGHFVTIEDLYGPARQMLADPRAESGVGAFYDWWLKLAQIDTLTKDTTVFPSFNAQLAADMHGEVKTFALNVTLDMSGTYETLLTAPFSFVNERLAAIYGLGGITGDNLRMVSLNATERGGLLTLPGMQAQSSNPTRTSPARRGVAVVSRLLCMNIPAPPPSVPVIHDPVAAGVNGRQALEMHRVDPACAACHSLFDNYGLAFEAFDAIGRARTTDNGAPVDTSNLQLTAMGTPVATVDGAVPLENALAHNGTAQECMTRQWLTYALKQNDAGSIDANAVAQAHTPFRASGFNLKELIAAVMLTDAFLAP